MVVFLLTTRKFQPYAYTDAYADADAPQNEWVNFNPNPNPVTAGLSGVLLEVEDLCDRLSSAELYKSD